MEFHLLIKLYNTKEIVQISKKIYPDLGMRHFLKLALSRLRFQGTNYFGIRRNHLERFHQISGILFSPPPPLFAFRWFCLHRKFQRSRRLHHFFLTKKISKWFSFHLNLKLITALNSLWQDERKNANRCIRINKIQWGLRFQTLCS